MIISLIKPSKFVSLPRMSLFITSLNSGSNGNCYYVGNEHEAVLIDAGISGREIEKRMKRLNLSIQKVKAIFVSHEHGDHIKGIEFLIKKYQLTVYITEATLRNSKLNIDVNFVVHFKSYSKINIGSLSIIAFPKIHDACDPCSFIIDCNETKVGVFTDIGFPCDHVIKHFKQCHAAFLEANYDEVMLAEGRYPYHLKKRISGGSGHLSNKQALDLFIKHRPPFMSHLLLSHLSKNNNCPTLVHNLFNSHACNVQIIIASRDEETLVYHIQQKSIYKTIIKPSRLLSQQLTFSFV